MTVVRSQSVSIFVDRGSGQWIVLDSEGAWWVVQPNEHGWEQRQTYLATDESELEPVPGHYRYLFGLPY